MSDQTQATMNTAAQPADDIAISPADRAILRRLASRVAELAARPIEAEKRDLWYRHNALEATRPVIFCDPENGWDEIITAADLACTGELARGLGDAAAQGDLLGRRDGRRPGDRAVFQRAPRLHRERLGHARDADRRRARGRVPVGGPAQVLRRPRPAALPADRRG